ncbi:uncharacterized protein CIMG_13565 [Coccidioides immitis RS]|uniref:Uncharacterized protein n=1 Tax=Coccidioides immitis (strain RS) TaxID=246410 RepID=J3K1B3_COCIM|nr:uncharacterized protein CIMG_13565 [Coccidioides immitis RS]EAS27747.3 hypothetical protein CIMG_13565 [Coccidioides immitis RS]
MLSRSMGLIVVNILDLRAKLCRNAQKKRKSAAADIINKYENNLDDLVELDFVKDTNNNNECKSNM